MPHSTSHDGPSRKTIEWIKAFAREYQPTAAEKAPQLTILTLNPIEAPAHC